MALRMQVVLPARSGMAEDVFVNTYHLDGPDPDPGSMEIAADSLAAIMEQFYNEPHGFGVTQPVCSYLSNFIDRRIDTSRVVIYDMEDVRPRTPYTSFFQLGSAGSGGGISGPPFDLPEEVALCSSFAGTPPRTARRRGRVYHGPFNTLAVAADSDPLGFGPCRPNVGLMQSIAGATEWLVDTIDAGAAFGKLVIYSPTNDRQGIPFGKYTPIVSGWVDNAFDTQRRRGVDPTMRVQWPTGIQ